jgi:Zn-dependent peptidase ImmA (M78 family)
MSPGRPRYAWIERRVGELLDGIKLKRPPVPVEAIVRSWKGVAIRYSDLQDVSGLVVRKDGNVVIGVNQSHSPSRKRFTLAHEFAHVLLHEGKEVRFDTDFKVNLRSEVSTLGTDVEEVEANFFAAALLMPRRCLDSDPRTLSIDFEDAAVVQQLAKEYMVSTQAMQLRLVNLYGRRMSASGRSSLPF